VTVRAPSDPHPAPSSSVLVIVGALVAFGAFATAAVLFINGDGATERLGLLFAMFGTIVAALIAALRSDHAAKLLNGGLDDRIYEQVEAALAVRASSAPRDRWTDPVGPWPPDPDAGVELEDPPAPAELEDPTTPAPGGPHDPAGLT
jgi:hypothetical protein